MSKKHKKEKVQCEVIRFDEAFALIEQEKRRAAEREERRRAYQKQVAKKICDALGEPQCYPWGKIQRKGYRIWQVVSYIKENYGAEEIDFQTAIDFIKRKYQLGGNNVYKYLTDGYSSEECVVATLLLTAKDKKAGEELNEKDIFLFLEGKDGFCDNYWLDYLRYWHDWRNYDVEREEEVHKNYSSLWDELYVLTGRYFGQQYD